MSDEGHISILLICAFSDVGDNWKNTSTTQQMNLSKYNHQKSNLHYIGDITRKRERVAGPISATERLGSTETSQQWRAVDDSVRFDRLGREPIHGLPHR